MNVSPLRIFSAFCIVAPFLVFAFALQIAYDVTPITSKPWIKASYFVVALLIGSFAYDLLKVIIFMKSDKYLEFVFQVGLAIFWLPATFLFGAASAYLMSKNEQWLSLFFSIMMFVSLVISMNKVNLASEIASSSKNNKKSIGADCHASPS